MQRILAIAWLTWKAALRFRLFLVIAVLLVLAVRSEERREGKV